jgi:hypothetical protein
MWLLLVPTFLLTIFAPPLAPFWPVIVFIYWLTEEGSRDP